MAIFSANTNWKDNQLPAKGKKSPMTKTSVKTSTRSSARTKSSVKELKWNTVLTDSPEKESLEPVADAPEEVEEDVDSDYASSDKEVEYDFEDDEVASTQKNFNPIEGGSLGSFIAYMSDDSDTECEVPQSEMMIKIYMSQAWEQ